jgi:hypothetical protein
MTITPTAAPQLQAADLAMVLLVRDDDRPGPVPTVRLAELAEVTRRLTVCGVSAVKVFASGRRDALGWGGSMSGCLMARAVREIKNAEPGMVVMTETCLCSYTLTGDCHLADHTGVPDVPGTVETLAAQAVVQAAEGADIVGPAAMIRGSVAAIREALDSSGHQRVEIMPHLIVRSHLYRGYRRAVLVDISGGFPGVPLKPAWPQAAGDDWEPPRGRGWTQWDLPEVDARQVQCPSCAAPTRVACRSSTGQEAVDHRPRLEVAEAAGHATERALVSWLPIKTGLTPHGLRHSHKVWMIEDGIPEVLSMTGSGT